MNSVNIYLGRQKERFTIKGVCFKYALFIQNNERPFLSSKSSGLQFLDRHYKKIRTMKDTRQQRSKVGVNCSSIPASVTLADL